MVARSPAERAARTAELTAWLQDVSYRTWSLQVETRLGGDLLSVRFMDPMTGQIQRGRKWFVSRHATKSEVIQTALKAVLACEEHEARERFTYRGRRIFGPHFNVDALVEACDYGTEDRRAD